MESLKAVAIVDGCVTFFAFLSCVFKILIIQRKQAIIRPPPFHISQLYFILDQLETLFSMFDMFANGLQDGTFSRFSFEYESICRFPTHLCLFLQMIEVPIPPEPVKVILESYLAVLEASSTSPIFFCPFLTSFDRSGCRPTRSNSLIRWCVG